jgi:hypothetical protein
MECLYIPKQRSSAMPKHCFTEAIHYGIEVFPQSPRLARWVREKSLSLHIYFTRFGIQKSQACTFAVWLEMI